MYAWEQTSLSIHRERGQVQNVFLINGIMGLQIYTIEYMKTCIKECIHTSMPTNTRDYLTALLYIYMRTCLHGWIHNGNTNKAVFAPFNMQCTFHFKWVCVLAFDIHTYILSYGHTYVHT